MRKSIANTLIVGLCFFSAAAHEASPVYFRAASGASGANYCLIDQPFYLQGLGASGSREGESEIYQTYVTSNSQDTGIHLLFTSNQSVESSTIRLKVEEINKKKLNYQLYNNQGAMVLKEKIITAEVIIISEALNPTVYYLEIKNTEQIVKTFKILKE